MTCRCSAVQFCCRPRCGLIVTLLLIQCVGQTTLRAQNPVSGGQIPPYEVQHPYPGVDSSRDGYQGEADDGTWRPDGRVSRISGQELRPLLQRVDAMLSNQCTKNVAEQWRFETDVNPATQQAAVSHHHHYHHYLERQK